MTKKFIGGLKGKFRVFSTKFQGFNLKLRVFNPKLCVCNLKLVFFKTNFRVLTFFDCFAIRPILKLWVLCPGFFATETGTNFKVSGTKNYLYCVNNEQIHLLDDSKETTDELESENHAEFQSMISKVMK
jgi:hypothetical protein